MVVKAGESTARAAAFMFDVRAATDASLSCPRRSYTQTDERRRRRGPRTGRATRAEATRATRRRCTWSGPRSPPRDRGHVHRSLHAVRGAISYRVLFSLFPLTIALVSIFGLVLQDDE